MPMASQIGWSRVGQVYPNALFHGLDSRAGGREIFMNPAGGRWVSV